MTNQLNLFPQPEPEPKKTKLYKFNTKIDKEASKIFWEKVRQEQAKSKMTQHQADFIVENLLDWDQNELEVQLILAGASESEKDFYLNFLYLYARKHRDMFERLYLGIY